MLKKKRVSRAVCLGGVVVGLVLSAGAGAQTASYPVTATCSGGGQLCNNIVNLNVTTTGALQSTFVAGAGLCSSIRIHYLVDGNAAAVTSFVGAGASTGSVNLGPVSSGSHVLGLQAEGQVGGCNVGSLGSWAGTAQVTTGAAPQATIPTLSPGTLAALAAAVAVAGWMALRRRKPQA